MDFQSLPFRACRLVSDGVLSVIPADNRLVGSLKKRATDFLNDRRSIAPATFKGLIDNYECLIDPLVISHGERTIAIPLIWYELRIGYSYVLGAVLGYQGTNAQRVVDMVYEARSLTFSHPEN